MAKTLRLSPDGPHHDEYTCQVATALSEGVRLLNHATRSQTGVAFPSTLHYVLGCGSAAVFRLDQSLSQIAETLQRMLTSGQLGSAHRSSDEPFGSTLVELPAAWQTVHTLTAQLDRAFNATASLHLVAGREG